MPNPPSESWKNKLLRQAESAELQSEAGRIPAGETVKKYLKDREKVLADLSEYADKHEELTRKDLEDFFGIKEDGNPPKNKGGLLDFFCHDQLEQAILFWIYRKLDQRSPAYYEKILDLDPVKDEALWSYITAIESEIVRQKKQLVLKSANILGPDRLAALMMLLEDIRKLEQEEFEKVVDRATERLSDPDDPWLRSKLYEEFSRLTLPRILKDRASELKKKLEENEKKIADNDAGLDTIEKLIGWEEEQAMHAFEPKQKHEKKEGLVLDPEALAPYQDKIKIQEKTLLALDNFLASYPKTESKPQRSDFVQTFRELVLLTQSQLDPIAKALSDDILERILVNLSQFLLYPPPVLGEIKAALNKNKNELLERVLEHVKTLHSGIVENKKKVLWLLAKHIGIKRSAAIFKIQDLIKERARAEYPKEHSSSILKEPSEDEEHETIDTIAEEFGTWYFMNKEQLFLQHKKLRAEIANLFNELGDDSAFKIIEQHLSTNPREIFEIFRS